MITLVLIHSPIVGPLTWTPVALEIRSRGHEALIAELPYNLNPDTPFWQLHAGAVARDLYSLTRGRTHIPVGHSGAGLLLPAIRQLSSRPAIRLALSSVGRRALPSAR